MVSQVAIWFSHGNYSLVLFFWMGKKRGEFFSLFVGYEHKKNAMLRVREMNREMNICSPKAFWKSWTNGTCLAHSVHPGFLGKFVIFPNAGMVFYFNLERNSNL